MLVETRLPNIEDSPEIYKLIQSSPPLDLNSRYLYMLQTTHFRDTCIVADFLPEDGSGNPQIAGFISGYRLPDNPESFFVWQVAVSASARGKGVAKKMALDLLKRPVLKNVNQIMTTVTPSNSASLKLFKSLARSLNTNFTEEMGFESNLFGGEAHEPEMLYRIGPFKHAEMSLD